MATWRAVAVLLVTTGASGLAGWTPAEEAATAALPFDIDRRGAVTVSATINDFAPLRFLIDTGSNRSVISDTVVARLGLPVIAQSGVTTMTGQTVFEVARLDRLAIGPILRTNTAALVVPQARLRDVAPKLDGVVGQDVLIGLDYTLDYRKRQVRWGVPTDAQGANAKGGGAALRLVVDNGRYLVEMPQQLFGEPLMLVPDSGASDIVIHRRWAQSLALKDTSLSAHVRSVAGAQSGAVMLLPELQVGGMTLRDRLVVVVDGPSSASSRPDGLLPLHQFSSVSFNARERSLTVR